MASPTHGDQPPASPAANPVQVALAPFEIWGNATVEIADAISTSLTALLKDDACFEVVSRTSPSVAYIVEGSIQAEPKRPIAALQLVDPKTGELFWSENYDYTNISGDMMARDVYTVLRSGTRCAHRSELPNNAFEPSGDRQLRRAAGALRESAPAARSYRPFAAAQRKR